VAGVVIVAGIAAAALLARPAVRERAGRSVRDLRAKIETRAASADALDIEDDIAATTEPTELLPTESPTPSEDVAVAEMAVADVEGRSQPDLRRIGPRLPRRLTRPGPRSLHWVDCGEGRPSSGTPVTAAGVDPGSPSRECSER
jgi:hypothetical protein